MEKKSGLFLFLCFISLLFITAIISTILLLVQPLIMPSIWIISLITMLVILMLSSIGYFSLKYFDIQDKTVLSLTSPISIIASIVNYVEFNYVRKYLEAVQDRMGAENLAFAIDPDKMFNVWLLIISLVIIFNLPAIMSIILRKK